jgi:hypothetical protein
MHNIRGITQYRTLMGANPKISHGAGRQTSPMYTIDFNPSLVRESTDLRPKSSY